MTKDFIEKVFKYGIVDTKKYRYVSDDAEIKRLPITDLGTTKALTSWVTVWRAGENG